MREVETIKELFRLADLTGADIGVISGFNAAKELRRIARALHRLNERECNGVIGPDGFAKWDDADQAKADKRRAKLEKEALDYFKLFLGASMSKLRIEFKGDPRGASIVVYGAGSSESASRLAAFW